MTNAQNLWEQLRACTDPELMSDAWMGALADALREDDTRVSVRLETAVRWLVLAGRRPALRTDVVRTPWIFVREPSVKRPYTSDDGLVYRLHRRHPFCVIPSLAFVYKLGPYAEYANPVAAVNELADRLTNLKAALGVSELVVPTEAPGPPKSPTAPL